MVCPSCRTKQVSRVILAVLAVLLALGCESAEFKELKKAKEADNAAALTAFLNKFPQGRHKAEAQQALDRLEEKDFPQAKQENSVKAFDGFLTRFPRGKLARQAEELRDGLLYQEAIQKGTAKAYRTAFVKLGNTKYGPELGAMWEETFYKEASQAKNLDDLKQYLSIFPKGIHRNEAMALVQDLEWIRVQEKAALNAFKNYIKQYPNSPHLEKAKAALAEVEVYEKAAKEDWYKAYKDYLKKFPQGLFAAKARERLDWLKKQKAVVEVDYPKVVKGSDRFEWEIIFKEKGGKIGYRVKGIHGYTVDGRGRQWGPMGMYREVKEKQISQGGVKTHASWVSGNGDHSFCNGADVMNWKGEDAAGNKISFTTKIKFEHKGCKGAKKAEKVKKPKGKPQKASGKAGT
jgi:outer membrane protein assembly factor BamD (BamD/ComL family)